MPVYFTAVKQSIDGKNKLSTIIPDIVKEFTADQLNAFTNLSSNIVDIIVDYNNIAVLLEDGTIHRTTYVMVEKGVVDCKQSIVDTPTLAPVKHTIPNGANRINILSETNPFQRSQLSSTRRQRMRAVASSLGRRVLLNRPMPASSSVPEHLIEQCQVVLQGKSRSLIVRELRRTSLDVNLAVNNLLSRDDNGEEEFDEDGEGSSMSDDLLSLLDARVSIESLADETTHSDIDSLFGIDGDDRNERMARTIADSTFFLDIGHRLRERRHLQVSKLKKLTQQQSKKKVQDQEVKLEEKQEISVGSSLQAWTRKDKDSKPFIAMTSTYSSLYALTSDGKLAQWKWMSEEPYYDELTNQMQNLSDQLNTAYVKGFAGSPLQLSLFTANDEVASYFDPMVTSCNPCKSPNKQECSLKGYGANETIIKIYNTNTMSLVINEIGQIFWWGLHTFETRKKLYDNSKHKKDSSQYKKLMKEDIVVGSQVMVRVNPIYNVGAIAIAFIELDGQMQPVVGQLLESVWNIGEKKRFKLLDQKVPTDLITKICQKQTDQDKTDMPPPPSPASSTCSDSSFSGSGCKKRKKKTQSSKVKEQKLSESKNNELIWDTSETLFIEDHAAKCIGKVIKIDGKYAAVKYPAKSENQDSDPQDYRIFRKSELILVNGLYNYDKVDAAFVNVPQKLNFEPCSSKIFSVAIYDDYIYVIYSNKLSTEIFTCKFNLNTNMSDNETKMSKSLNHGLSDNINFYSNGESWPLLLTDSHNSFYEITNNVSTENFIPFTGRMPCLTSACVTPTYSCNNSSARYSVMAFVIRKNLYNPPIICSSINLMKAVIDINAMGEKIASTTIGIDKLKYEYSTGGCNILHTAVVASQHLKNKTSGKVSIISEEYDDPMDDNIQDIMRRASNTMSKCGPNNNMDSALDNIDQSSRLDKDIIEPLAIMQLLTDDSSFLAPHLYRLLCETNAFNMTPFMQAVQCKAYEAALLLLSVIIKISNAKSKDKKEIQKYKMTMIYPTPIRSDTINNNPLYVLCSNDTCSFTWTGAEHINQDIFECITCGLVGSLCCCTECAKTCHKGHECKIKETHPTAYCDCWERCKCKSLIQGNNEARYDLLKCLVYETNLTDCTKKNEHIIMFLVDTNVRQMKEQKQFKPMNKRKSIHPAYVDSNMPEHDLEPPKFARKALIALLNDWLCLKSCINQGYVTPLSSPYRHDDSKYLNSQSSTTSLDRFTMQIVTRCHLDFIEVVLTTLNTAVNGKYPLAEVVVRRFIRSVARIFLVHCMDRTITNAKSKPTEIALRCRKVFTAFSIESCEELTETALSLFAPILMNVITPCSSQIRYSQDENITAIEQLFLNTRSSSSDTISTDNFENNTSSVDDTAADGIIDEMLSQSHDIDLVIGESEPSEVDEEIESDLSVDLIEESESEDDPQEEDTDMDLDPDLTNTLPYDVVTPPNTTAPDPSSSLSAHLENVRERNPQRAAPPDPLISWSSNANNLPNSTSMSQMKSRSNINVGNTSTHLARSFGILLRMISDILSHHGNDQKCEQMINVKIYIKKALVPIKRWLANILDVTEAQLVSRNAYQNKYGVVENPQIKRSTEDVGHSFMHYALSLMRLHSNEHSDHILPPIDADAYRHIAYTLDAFAYFIRMSEVNDNGNCYECDEDISINNLNLNDPRHESSKFFKRSESTTFLGSTMQNNFMVPLAEDLPLAEKPHLLKPDARKQTLFGAPPCICCSLSFEDDNNDEDTGISFKAKTSISKSIPQNLSFSKILSVKERETKELEEYTIDKEDLALEITFKSNNALIGRWHQALDLFGMIFTDDVALEPGSVINELGGFPAKEAKFMKKMEQLSIHQLNCLSLTVDREHALLIVNTFTQINHYYQKRKTSASYTNNTTPPLAVQIVKVKYRNEPGEGTGVARSFYTAFANAILSPEKIKCFEKVIIGSKNYPYGLLQKNKEKRRVKSRDEQSTSTTSMQSPSIISNPLLSSTAVTSSMPTSSANTATSSSSSLSPQYVSTRTATSRFNAISRIQYRRSTRSAKKTNTSTSTPNTTLNSSSLTPMTSSNSTNTTATIPTDTTPVSSTSLHATTPSSSSATPASSNSTPSSIAMSMHSNMPSTSGLYTSNYSPGTIMNAMNSFHTPSMLRHHDDAADQPMNVYYNEEVDRLWNVVWPNNEGFISAELNLRASSAPFSPSLNEESTSIGDVLYKSVNRINQRLASRITGMLLEMSRPDIDNCLKYGYLLRRAIDEAIRVIEQSNTLNPDEIVNDLLVIGKLNTDRPLKRKSHFPELEPNEDNSALFWQPGKKGYYAPRPGNNSMQRWNAFRNVGRIMGLCLLQNEMCPIPLVRHVLKYILDRPICWHDLAFCDPTLYESLRKLILEAKKGKDSEVAFKAMDLFFHISVPEEEGGHEVDLIEDGADRPVTPQNVFIYVKLYAEYRMVKVSKYCLANLREGIFDVLPANSLDGLTAEDLRLLLNGIGEVDVNILMSYTVFNNETGESIEKITRFKKWFWSVLEKMTSSQKHDLIYFWMSCSTLPASGERFEPKPSINIRNLEENYLPTANTCISRLYLPLYSSKQLLKSKLLLAIRTRSFGFV